MNRALRVTLVSGGLIIGAACSDNLTGPSPFTAALNRYHSVLDDSAAVQLDSVEIDLPATAHWLLAHGNQSWNTPLTTFGTGTSWIHWRRDPTTLLPGTWVDTFTVQRNDGGAAIQFLDSLVIRTIPSPYITVRRPWLPGERDSAAKAIASLYGVGLEASVLALDSTVVIVPNPLYHPAASNFPNMVLSPTQSGMTMVGVDLYEMDSTVTPPVTVIQWLQAFWYNTAEPTWKGYTVVFSTTATTGPVSLNDNTWTSNGGTSGGGGGDARLTTGEFWQATSGKMQITSNTARTAAGTIITSGPDSGGVQRNGLMGGKQVNVTLTEVTPTPGATQTFSVDFRTTAIPAARIECVNYGSPPSNTLNAVCHP